MSYSIARIPGISAGAHRSVVFLECPEDRGVTAREGFDSLKDNLKRDFLSRLDHWQDGGIFDKYHHGWPNIPDRKEFYVFKATKSNTRYRLYGFLTHPRTQEPRFLACVLAVYAQKNTEETDPAHLAVLSRVRHNEDVMRAVADAFSQGTTEHKNSIQEHKHGTRKTLDRRK